MNTQHARPHLQTHTRSDNHSAVAGAAYRLGLKLLDERTGVWHDFHRRSLRGEIILALTIAPQGASAWATDPQALWSRVEFAEKRKDAQVARDYRIPIPLGLTELQAGILSEQMAHFISDALMTPVSVGVHRDSSIDVLGEKKLASKIGYHAHLYFPTRRLDCFEERSSEQDRQAAGEGTGVTGFGSKLTVLSNRRTSAEFVEQLNAHWAKLANELCGLAGLPVDYDHRSYTRQGVDICPQPLVGQMATALERKGVKSRMGSRLREVLKLPGDKQDTLTTSELQEVGRDIGSAATAGVATKYDCPSAEADGSPDQIPVPTFLSSEPLPQKVATAETGEYQAASVPRVEPVFPGFAPANHQVFLERLQARREQEAASGTSSSGGQSGAMNRVVASTESRKRERLAKSRERSEVSSAFAPTGKSKQHQDRARKSAHPVMDEKPSLETLVKRHHLVVMKSDSIAARLQKTIQQPLSAMEKTRFARSLVLVVCLEKVLAMLEAAKQDEEKKAEIYERAKAAALDADFQVDQARAVRKVASSRFDLWKRNRAKTFGLWSIINSGKRRGFELERDWRWKHDLVQSAKRASHTLHEFSKEALRALRRVQGLITDLRRELAVTAVDLRSRNLRMFEEFSRWLSVRQRHMLEEAMPTPVEVEPKAEQVVATGTTGGAGGGDAPRGDSQAFKPNLELGKRFRL